MIKYYCVNGEMTPIDSAKLKVTDLTILRGYGIFDFFLVRGGVPLFIDDYMDRFEKSAERMGLDLTYSRKQIIGLIKSLIEKNGLEDAGIRLVLTGGYAADGYTPTDPNFLILEHPLPTYTPDHFEEGVKIISVEFLRVYPEIKTTNYIVGIRELKRMKAAGAKDVLFQYNGEISETTRSNFFMVTPDDVLITPPVNILQGITRKKVLALARKHFNVEERTVRMEDLKTAKEAFITSSTKGTMPVVQVDDLQIGNGKPGKVTLKLLELFREYTEAYVAGKTS